MRSFSSNSVTSYMYNAFQTRRAYPVNRKTNWIKYSIANRCYSVFYSRLVRSEREANSIDLILIQRDSLSTKIE